MLWMIILTASIVTLIYAVRKKKAMLRKASAIMASLSIFLWICVYAGCMKCDRTSYSDTPEKLSYQLIYTLSKGKELEGENGSLHTQDYYYYTSRDVLKLEDYEIISNKAKAEDVKLRMISDEIPTPSIEVYVRYHEPLLNRKEWLWLTLFGSSDESLDNYIIDHYEISVTQDVLDNDMNYIESESFSE